ncbi:MAG: STAS/SEC14 domain-containing protein [Pseudomonadota bacterium]
MIEEIADLPTGIWGYVASGKVSQYDADTVMNSFDDTTSTGYDVAVLSEFIGSVDLSGVSEEIRRYNRLMSRGRVRRFAFVGDQRHKALFDDYVSFAECEARMFPPGSRDAAIAWLKEAPFLTNANGD